MINFDKPVLINKSSGPTSFGVISQLRRITGIKKIGHTGTLDPLASGLLIVLIGPARKKQAEFQNLDKEYEAEITFGKETDTYDSQGKVVKEYDRKIVKELTKEKITEILPNFLGEQIQTVPAFSAIKINGQKLYEKARKGTINATELPNRKIVIEKIEILSFTKAQNNHPPKCILSIKCSKGTYIRSLASDIGKKLQTGAYISQLKRTAVGNYRLENALTLEKFQEQV